MFPRPAGIRTEQCDNIIGVDEVGMGAVLGPLVVAAVVITPGKVAGVRDSKMVSNENTRFALAEDIKRCASAWKIAQVSNDYIDQHGLDAAWDKAVVAVIEAIRKEADLSAVVDGGKLPSTVGRVFALPKADRLIYQVSAASLVAKAHRDAIVIAAAQRYPQYGLEENKGYPTKKHLDALRRFGPTPLHRKSFRATTDPEGSMRREELKFDKSSADKMIGDLSGLQSNPLTSDWEKQYVSDMVYRLKNNLELSPRQMFFLQAVHGRRRKRS